MPPKGRKRTVSLGSTSPTSPSESRPLKQAKTPANMSNCVECGVDPLKMAIACATCNAKFCVRCCGLGEAFITKYNLGKLKGLVWKCDTCLNTATTLDNISSKLNEMEENNRKRNEEMKDEMKKNLDEMEEKITKKVLAEIPPMIENEMKKFDGKLDEKLETTKKEINKDVTTRMKKVENQLSEVKELMVTKDEVDDLVKFTVDTEIERKSGEGGISKETVEQMIEEARPVDAGLTKEEVENMIKAAVAAKLKTPPAPTPPPAQTTNQISPNTLVRNTLTEMRNRQQKEKNLVIYNLEEPDTNIKRDRIEEDKKKIVEIASEILDIKNLKKDDLVRAERLGEKKENRRPLLLEFKEEKKRSLVLRKAAKLKDSDYQHISIAYDMTPQEREQLKKMREEAKQKQESEGGRWLYKVRGPPWAMKIVKTEKKEEKKEENKEEEEKMEEEQAGGSGSK